MACEACDLGPRSRVRTRTCFHSAHIRAYPATALLVVRGAVEGGGGGIILVVGGGEGVGVGRGQRGGLAAVARGPVCLGVWLIGK